MGIQGLMKLIGDYAPSAIKNNDIKSYFGKVYPYTLFVGHNIMKIYACHACISDLHMELCSPPGGNTF